MFRPVREKTIGKGVLRTFAPSLGEWEVIAEGGLDILGSIPYDSLIDSVLGTAWIRGLLGFLTVIGYVGSTYSFIHLIWVLYNWYTGRNKMRRRRRRRRGRRPSDELPPYLEYEDSPV